MQFKKFVCACTLGAVLATSAALPAEAAGATNIIINGVSYQCDASCAPQNINGRVYVPLRVVSEGLGHSVSWDNATRTVIASRNGVDIRLTIGQNILYKNGQAIALDVPAKIMNDRTMVPVRAIAEAFSADVDWVQAAQLVTIVE